MFINPVDANIIENSADLKRKIAKETIEKCIELGVGVYEIRDDIGTFGTVERMASYLKRYCGRPWRISRHNFMASVITRETKTRVFVVVKEFGAGK